jgi:hypothetical protein
MTSVRGLVANLRKELGDAEFGTFIDRVNSVRVSSSFFYSPSPFFNQPLEAIFIFFQTRLTFIFFLLLILTSFFPSILLAKSQFFVPLLSFAPSLLFLPFPTFFLLLVFPMVIG